MNKELSELKELIAEREKAESDFLDSVVKLDIKINSLMVKIQNKVQPPDKPVEVAEHKRGLPRKTRSDKGQPRKRTTPEGNVPLAQSGGDSKGEPTTIDPAYMQPDPEE